MLSSNKVFYSKVFPLSFLTYFLLLSCGCVQQGAAPTQAQSAFVPILVGGDNHDS